MKKILALFLAVMFVFSAIPVYAAEVEETAIQPRGTIFNHANYLIRGQKESFQIVITSATDGNYTCTIVVDEMGGEGLQVNLQRIGGNEKPPIYYTNFKGKRQVPITLEVGTYVLDINARDALAYSITISN